jgi:HSP20 family protein
MAHALIPWRNRVPHSFDELRHDFDEWMGGLWGDQNGSREFVNAPRTNIAETEQAYEVTMDLPGIKPSEVNVEICEGHLCVSGEHKEEKEEKGKTYHRVERQYGQFRRVIPLGAGVESDKVDAKYKDGVLKISVPKSKEALSHRIEVKA